MGNKKSQNSIVFLTTLGVYLGLLMVGASPGVLAQQAAMTRNFDVKDEIEVKDDVDRDPNGCDEVLAEAIERARFHGVGRPEVLSDYSEILRNIASTLVRYEPYNRSAYQEAGADPFTFYLNVEAPKLHPKNARSELEVQFDRLAQLVPAPETNKSAFALTSRPGGNVDELVASIDRSDEYDAFRLFVSLSAALKYSRCESSQSAVAEILARTRIVHRKDQVFIVTRLPRAALDPLLGLDAK